MTAPPALAVPHLARASDMQPGGPLSDRRWHFKGGATKSLTLPAPRRAWQDRTTDANVVAEIDRLLDDHTCAEIAVLLNERGRLSACGRPFHGDRVDYLCRAYALKHRRERLREAGLLTLPEVAAKLGISTHTVKLRRLAGRLAVGARKLDDCGRHMYEDPDAQPTPGAPKIASAKGGVV